MRKLFPLFLSIACVTGASAASGADEPVDYLKQIKPILASRCFACHGALKQEAGLRLDASAKIRSGGDSGPTIVAGKSGESLLVQKITAGEDSRMPPEGEPLTAEQIALLKTWIEQGALAPEEAPPPNPREHWSFKSPLKATPPTSTAATQPANPIDAFLDSEQQKHALHPLPAAAKPLLLRRVYLDLIGLPPTPEELHAFLADDSPTAYEAVVDRLLASPQYAERWARHWMDIWRYSDWFGLGGELRSSQRHIWRWRDWIIQSLNEDKSYDRMIVEMLAADELTPDDPRNLPAMGFIARNWYIFNRNLWIDGIVEHTGRGLLGLTVNCARCHDHKYDPISQKDYYRLRAFFEPHNVRTDRVPGELDVVKDGMPRVYDEKLDAQTFLLVRGDEKNPDKEHPLEPGVPAFLEEGKLAITPIKLPLSGWHPDGRPFVGEQMIASADKAAAQAETTFVAARQALAAARARASNSPVQQVPAPAPLFVDDFSKSRPELWKMSPGEWQYADGHLMLKPSATPQQCRLTANESHPRDFSATLRFRVLGGEHRTVGMIFDADDGAYHGVYVSSSVGRVQFYHMLSSGAEIHPPQAGRPVALEDGRQYELKFAVRDRLVNVWLDGKLQVAYRMDRERKPGRLAITGYLAVVEFLGMSLAPLPPELPLAESVEKAIPDAAELAADVMRQERGVAAVDKNLAMLKTEAVSVRARVAAEKAKYAEPADATAGDLALAAAMAERTAAVAKAELKIVTADQKLATAKEALAANPQQTDPQKADAKKQEADAAAAEKELADARAALEAAKTALANDKSANFSPLGPVYPQTSSGRRLALARWIADRGNPLTARVAVNHIWARHFGEPIVDSMFDFGLRTKAPALQPLLDWLAVEFMDSGWSMKHMHRLMVTSNAYRRSSGGSADDADLAKIDPDNHYYWRMNTRGMEAELVRDSLLKMGDSLDPAIGGRDLPTDSADTTFRRSIYYRYARDDSIKFMTLFDAPSVEECYRRQSTIVPQQALVMFNSKMALTAAARVAAVVQRDLGGESTAESRGRFVASAYERIFSRAVSDAERGECMQALDKLETSLRASVKPGESSELKARETLVHVLLNHNDFVTLR